MRSLSIAVLWLAPSLALAQTAPTPTELLGPANPALKGPPVTYRSAFDGRPAEPAETPWKDANDEVRRLGGHIGILQEDDTAPGGHAGHSGEGAAAAASPQKPTGHHHE